ncbi:MAG: hypothetical protein Q7U28_09300 [Aquabacterium sp.]|nr:hypothetical protein [Aquabacterium sp.]
MIYSAKAIFDAMAAIVEQPGYAYLQAYKDDFYKQDRATILNELAPGAMYLWVVNPNGTHLTRIGVHVKMNEWAMATMKSGLESTKLGAEIYLISVSGVIKVCEQQVEAELRRWHYAVADKTVRDAKGQLIAVFEVRTYMKQGDGNQYADVMFQSSRLQYLTRADLLALRDIGTSETVTGCGSFFAKTDKLTINGQCIQELLDPDMKIVSATASLS